MKHPLHLLPWYLNGQLEDSQQQLVEQHLEQCFYCQQEHQQLSQLKRQVAALWQDARPGELELKRLLKEIQPHPAKPANPNKAFPLQAVRSNKLKIFMLVLLVQLSIVGWLLHQAPVSLVAPTGWSWQLYRHASGQLSPLIRQHPPRLLLGPNDQGEWLLAWPSKQPPAWLEREQTSLRTTDATSLSLFLAQ